MEPLLLTTHPIHNKQALCLECLAMGSFCLDFTDWLVFNGQGRKEHMWKCVWADLLGAMVGTHDSTSHTGKPALGMWVALSPHCSVWWEHQCLLLWRWLPTCWSSWAIVLALKPWQWCRGTLYEECCLCFVMLLTLGSSTCSDGAVVLPSYIDVGYRATFNGNAVT